MKPFKNIGRAPDDSQSTDDWSGTGIDASKAIRRSVNRPTGNATGRVNHVEDASVSLQAPVGWDHTVSAVKFISPDALGEESNVIHIRTDDMSGSPVAPPRPDSSRCAASGGR